MGCGNSRFKLVSILSVFELLGGLVLAPSVVHLLALTVGFMCCAQDKLSKDDFLGGFMISVHEVPLRKPPESPLAPVWYRLESKTGKGRVRGTCKTSFFFRIQ